MSALQSEIRVCIMRYPVGNVVASFVLFGAMESPARSQPTWPCPTCIVPAAPVEPEPAPQVPRPPPLPEGLASGVGTQVAPAHPGPTQEPRAGNAHHITVGVVGAPFVLLSRRDGWQPFVGASLLPEIRYSLSGDHQDTWRFYISGRWTALSTSTAQAEVPASRTNNEQLLGVMGFSWCLTNAKPSEHRVTTGIGWFSLGIGYGNFRSANGSLIEGASLLVSFDMDGLSFNLGGES